MHRRARRKAGTLSFPGGWERRAPSIVRTCGLSVEIVPEGGDVRVTEPKARRACTATVLCAGGWIACPTARLMAERLDVPTRKLGRLLDTLRIKIRHCELGCF